MLKIIISSPIFLYEIRSWKISREKMVLDKCILLWPLPHCWLDYKVALFFRNINVSGRSPCRTPVNGSHSRTPVRSNKPRTPGRRTPTTKLRNGQTTPSTRSSNRIRNESGSHYIWKVFFREYQFKIIFCVADCIFVKGFYALLFKLCLNKFYSNYRIGLPHN